MFDANTIISEYKNGDMTIGEATFFLTHNICDGADVAINNFPEILQDKIISTAIYYILVGRLKLIFSEGVTDESKIGGILVDTVNKQLLSS